MLSLILCIKTIQIPKNQVSNESSSASNSLKSKIDDLSKKNAKGVSDYNKISDFCSNKNEMARLLIHDTLFRHSINFNDVENMLHLRVVNIKILQNGLTISRPLFLCLI